MDDRNRKTGGETLRAEQPTRDPRQETATEWLDRQKLATDQPQQAMREMTPDEIRRDELGNLIERIGMEERGRSIRVALRIIRERIGALTPETLTETVFGEPEMVAVPKYSAEAAGLAYVSLAEQHDNKVRVDELANLLDFIEGDPIDGSPSQIEVINGIRVRIAELSGKDRPEPLTAEQPSNGAVARISGALTSEARELNPIKRIEFLTEIVAIASRLVEETPDVMVMWPHDGMPGEKRIREMELAGVLSRDDEPQAEQPSHEDHLKQLLGRLGDIQTTIESAHALPAAIELLNGPSSDHIPNEERSMLSAKVAEALASRI